MKIKYLILMTVILLTACSKAAEPPMEAISKAEIQAWQTEKFDFFEENLGAWPDLNMFYAQFAEEAIFTDPTAGDFIEGKDSIVTMFRNMTLFYPNIKIETIRRFISTDGIAYDNIWHNLWPPGVDKPVEEHPLRELDLVQFQDNLVTDYTIMYSKQTQEMIEAGCFAVDKCPELQEIVDRYLAAWSSGDEGQVAALYTEEAVFSDSLLGMGTVGSGAIADLASQRFGQIGDITLEEMGLYAQTNGPDAPAGEQPEMGRIVGVGIHYRWNAVVDDESSEVESLTAFYLNEQGLITREEVFHDPDSFLAAGLAP
jgi:ketosteroid isomerase-like protein